MYKESEIIRFFVLFCYFWLNRCYFFFIRYKIKWWEEYKRDINNIFFFFVLKRVYYLFIEVIVYLEIISIYIFK